MLYKMSILRCVKHHTEDTSHFTVEKVDFGYGGRKSSADGHYDCAGYTRCKIEYPELFSCQKRLDETADVDIAEG